MPEYRRPTRADRKPSEAEWPFLADDDYTFAEHEMGARIRASYILHRELAHLRMTGEKVRYNGGAKWDGKAAKSLEERRTKSVWPRLGREFLSLDLVPETVVQQVFDVLGPDKRMPMPNMLRSMWERLRGQPPSTAAEVLIREEYEISRHAIDRKVRSNHVAFGHNETDALLSALVDFELANPPILVYAIARKIGEDDDRFKDLAEAYRERAMLQYLTNDQGFWHVYKDWLPAEFPAEALAAYRKWRSRS